VPDTESAESVAATDAAAGARAAPWTGDAKERLTMMIHPEIYTSLARERTRTFVAEAEASRRSRPLRRPLGRPVRLRDGLAVLMRPVRPEDAGLPEDGFAGQRYGGGSGLACVTGPGPGTGGVRRAPASVVAPVASCRPPPGPHARRSNCMKGAIPCGHFFQAAADLGNPGRRAAAGADGGAPAGPRR
jgi:hypothetical protein